MSRIIVQPADATRRVPVEGHAGTYFEQGAPREVHHTRYIKRRLRDGDLVKVEPATPAAPAAPPAPPPASPLPPPVAPAPDAQKGS